ncbi:DEAD-box ATP-dependent RNA helicase 38, partial [Tanacetum coccineum]
VIMCSSISNDAVDAFVLETKKVLSEKEYISCTAKIKVPSLNNVKHYKVIVPDEVLKLYFIKTKILSSVKSEGKQTIIFVHTKEKARMLCEALKSIDLESEYLDGADTQEQIDTVFKKFKKKHFQVMISTKIFDWVFDRSQVGLVTFCDLWIMSGSSFEDGLERYSHCTGRGQSGLKGAVFNLMCGDMDKRMMEKIEMNNKVSEVPCTRDAFEEALKAAGL